MMLDGIIYLLDSVDGDWSIPSWHLCFQKSTINKILDNKTSEQVQYITYH